METVGFAMNSVDYAIQLVQVLKHTIDSYHQNPAEYKALLSRFLSIRKSLHYLQHSGTVDLGSPIWGSAFFRIRSHFDAAAVELKDIQEILRSNRFLKFVHASDISKRIKALEDGVDSLQRDLDLIGFFTASNHASAAQSSLTLSNVHDIQGSISVMEAKLDSIAETLKAFTDSQNTINAPNRQRDHLQEVSRREVTREVPTVRSENIGHEARASRYVPQRSDQRGSLVQRVREIQQSIERWRICLTSSSIPQEHRNRIASTLQSLRERWYLDPNDIKAHADSEIGTLGSCRLYRGSVTIRDVNGFIVREALASVKVLQRWSDGEEFQATILRQIFMLREMSHPCILTFYGAYWSDERNTQAVQRHHWADSGSESVVVATELITHNLRCALQQGLLNLFKERLEILRDVACGLEYLHSKGVVHLNVTLESILVRVIDGKVVGSAKIGDIGGCDLVRENFQDINRLPASQDPARENAHVPPEAGAHGHLDNSSSHPSWDSWSFGSLMCALLTTQNSGPSTEAIDRGGTFSESASGIRPAHSAALQLAQIPDPLLRALTRRCLSLQNTLRPSLTQIRKTIELVTSSIDPRGFHAVQNGDRHRQIGKEFLLGANGRPRDPGKAIKYFHRAAFHGNIPSLVDLGNCFFYGHGTAPNASRGIDLYSVAANAGHPSGQLRLGECYYVGVGLEKDTKKATDLFICAANQGNVPAQYKLGCHYYTEANQGRGDMQIAIQYWKDASKAGHRIAQFRLGFCLECGIGIPTDIAEARIWYTKSASKGHYGAKWALSRLNEQNK